MKGQTIVRQIIHATQLPKDYALKKLNTIIIEAGHNPENICLDDLRPLLAKFLQDTLLEAKRNFSQGA